MKLYIDIMNIQKLFTFFLIIVLLLSSCTKNPVDTGNNEDEERILFIRNSKEFSEICTMKPDGSDIRVISHYSYNNEYFYEGYYQARWSPDKSLIVVEGGPRESNEWNPLWLMDMNGNFLKKLVWAGRRPVWTSDGESVIYQRKRGYFALINDIYKVDINTLEEDTLIIAEDDPETQSFYMYYLMDLFPKDESKLILRETYVYKDTSGTQHFDDGEIIIYNYLDKQKKYLTNNNVREGWYVRISPDGDMIAYITKNDDPVGYYNIYIMTPVGEIIQQVTDGAYPYRYMGFSWSPDGQEILYAKSDQSEGSNEYGDISTIDVETGIETRLTNTVGDSVIYYVMDWK